MIAVVRVVCMVIVCGLFGAFLAAVILAWLAGCGEHYVDSRGVTHVNECVFINRNHRGA